MESLIINNCRYEIQMTEIPSPNSEDKFLCTMWQMDGVTRIHLYSAQWGATAVEAREKMNDSILKANE